MKSGALLEDLETNPILPYGIAKDTLRKSIEKLKSEKPFIFQWLRFFYIYGEGQPPGTLFSQLNEAIKNKHEEFNMSLGTQKRDYLRVEDVAENIILAISNSDIQGVINCCSGNSISIFDLVKKRCKELGSNIRINRGVYDTPQYEPFDFWGVPDKIKKMKKNK